MDKIEMVIIVIIVVVMVLTFLTNIVNNVLEMHAIRERLKKLTFEEEWHDFTVFDADLPEKGELCVLRIKYREYEGEPWEERYITSEWTGCEWTQDSMGFRRYQQESEITHWKAVKRIEE